jgi:hypothetical protein
MRTIKIKKEDDFSLLNVILSDKPFKDKIEAVRSSNPYFYLLTPQPKKEKHHE